MSGLKPRSGLSSALPHEASLLPHPCSSFICTQKASTACKHNLLDDNNDNNLQTFQLIILARYLLGVPKP